MSSVLIRNARLESHGRIVKIACGIEGETAAVEIRLNFLHLTTGRV
ncbi:hypothetical protein ABH909_000655 [Pseudomonas sp. BS3782 TE3695]